VTFETTSPNSEQPDLRLQGSSPLLAVWGWMKKYVEITRQLFLHPSQFFRNLKGDEGMSGPILYALVTHWLGTAVQFIWITWLGGRVAPTLVHWFHNLKEASQSISGRNIDDIEQLDSLGRNAAQNLVPLQEKLGAWVFGAGPVLLDPIKELFSILFLSAVIWVGARLLVSPGRSDSPSEVRFESSLQIVCYASAASVLSVIPLVGPGLSAFFAFVLATIGAREVWKTSTGRAIVIALFPNLLLYMAIASFVGLFLLAAFKLFFSMFGS
jgi:hypothetical protein